MDEFEFENDEYIEPADIRSFCRAMEEAWECSPDMPFCVFLEEVFPSALYEMTHEEMVEIMNDYILQNQ